jgi:hypothetical protein
MLKSVDNTGKPGKVTLTIEENNWFSNRKAVLTAEHPSDLLKNNEFTKGFGKTLTDLGLKQGSTWRGYLLIGTVEVLKLATAVKITSEGANVGQAVLEKSSAAEIGVTKSNKE